MMMVSPPRSVRSIRPLAMGLAVAALLVAALTGPATAAPGERRVRVELIGETTAIQPGGTVWVGLHQRIRPGWHTYWSNPGDSGEPTSIEWTLPAGFQAGAIEWPHPERI